MPMCGSGTTPPISIEIIAFIPAGRWPYLNRCTCIHRSWDLACIWTHMVYPPAVEVYSPPTITDSSVARWAFMQAQCHVPHPMAQSGAWLLNSNNWIWPLSEWGPWGLGIGPPAAACLRVLYFSLSISISALLQVVFLFRGIAWLVHVQYHAFWYWNCWTYKVWSYIAMGGGGDLAALLQFYSTI
jgi:hypothetical protein